MGEIQTPSPRKCRTRAGQGSFLIGMAGEKLHWPRGVAPARRTLVRLLRDGPIQQRSLVQPSAVLCIVCRALPILSCKYTLGRLHPPHHLLSFPTTSTISIISIISFSRPQVTRCSQPAACMHACVRPWHTTARPELIEYWDNAPAYLGTIFSFHCYHNLVRRTLPVLRHCTLALEAGSLRKRW